MKDVSFTVYGPIVGWQRAGYNRYTNVKYTQPKTRQKQAEVVKAYREGFGDYMFPEDSYLRLEVQAFFPIPKSATKAKREKMKNGEIRPTVKPDFDNIIKLVADALNGVAYKDDKQIVIGTSMKSYAYDEESWMHIRITEVQ